MKFLNIINVRLSQNRSGIFRLKKTVTGSLKNKITDAFIA